MAPDSITTWLELEKTLASDELAKAYEKIIPKKLLIDTGQIVEIISMVLKFGNRLIVLFS